VVNREGGELDIHSALQYANVVELMNTVEADGVLTGISTK
jgi:hypothetical protein